MTKVYNVLISLLIWSFFLHLLRNVNSAYVAIQGIIFLATCTWFYVSYKLTKSDVIAIATLCCVFFYVLLLSVIYNDDYGGAALGIFRFSSLIMAFLSALMVVRSDKVDVFWMVFSQFMALCALSLYFQFIFGPIDWFAESSERAGFSRYASLAGSLTVYGVICGMAIISSYFYFQGWKRILLISIIVSGGFISLQKAAIANIFIAAVGIAIIEKVSFRQLFKIGLIVLVIGAVVLWSTGLYDIAEVGFKSSLGAAGEDVQSDVSLLQSAFDRIIELPGIVFDFYGLNRLFWGMGVFGGSGSLGYPDLPMMHNAYFDIISIAGLPLFSALLIYFITLIYKVTYYFDTLNSADVDRKATVLIFLMSMLNMLFASGNFFQPVIAIILWVSVIYVARMRNRT